MDGLAQLIGNLSTDAPPSSVEKITTMYAKIGIAEDPHNTRSTVDNSMIEQAYGYTTVVMIAMSFAFKGTILAEQAVPKETLNFMASVTDNLDVAANDEKRAKYNRLREMGAAGDDILQQLGIPSAKRKNAYRMIANLMVGAHAATPGAVVKQKKTQSTTKRSKDAVASSSSSTD